MEAGEVVTGEDREDRGGWYTQTPKYVSSFLYRNYLTIVRA